MAPRILRILLSIVLVAGLCVAVQNTYLLHLAKTEYTLFTTLLSVTVVLARSRHSLGDLGILAVATLGFLAIASWPDHFRPGVPLTLSVLGVASLAVLGMQAFWSQDASRETMRWGFAASLILVASGWMLPPLLSWVARANPKSFDLYLLSFDASLRLQPSFLLGKLFFYWPAFGKLCTWFYMGIMCLCTLVFADHLTRNVKNAVGIFAAFLASGPIGILFYNLFPARGPLYLFGSNNFPLHPLPLDAIRHFHLEPVPVFGFPNAMPSLHMTWALFGFWYSRTASTWVRVVASFFLGFTILSTLGTGEHYLVDLVVSLPFALMLQAIFAFATSWTDPWRIRAGVFGAAATILWMTLLRSYPGYFWVSPLTPWALILATIGASLYLERHLTGAVKESAKSASESMVPQQQEPELASEAQSNQ